MSIQQVQTRGIYHGLPVYPPSLKNLTAVITGANGISGSYMLRVLAQDPARWSKIYCLSRRPPAIRDGLPQNAEHIACDFLGSKTVIAEKLKERGVRADYVFFYSYVQVMPKEGAGLWSDAEEMCKVNLALLQNFLEALALASITPRRIMLQTGAKNYGVHFGPSTFPQEETASRVELEPNFYYPQEDFLWDYCSKYNIGWNVCMPSFILGAAPDAAMNFVYPLGIYASVRKYLNETLEFPADLNAWETPLVGSSSMLNGYLEEWAVLEEGARNQKFNTADGSLFTWGTFWPRLGGWYGVEAGKPDLDESVYTEIRSQYDPPPRGFGPPAIFRSKFTLVSWAHQPTVQRAWAEMIKSHALGFAQKLEDMDIERIFGFTDMPLLGGALDLSMTKARKMGWNGFVDTNECFREVLDEFAGLGMLPEVGK